MKLPVPVPKMLNFFDIPVCCTGSLKMTTSLDQAGPKVLGQGALAVENSVSIYVCIRVLLQVPSILPPTAAWMVMLYCCLCSSSLSLATRALATVLALLQE